MEFPLKYWLPNKLNFDQDEFLIEWLYVGEKKYVEPFFESSILDCKNLSENQQKYKPTSTLIAMDEFSVSAKSLNPTAFIFHISRCGSTLISQLLSIDDVNIVISEAPFFDAILSKIQFLESNFSEEEIIKYFRASVKYYGQNKSGLTEKFYIKLDSWHILFYEIIRKAFPTTPFIFLYRKPDEVISSHQKQPGMQAIPGLLNPSIFGIKLGDNILENQNLYLIKVLEVYFEKLIYIAQNDQNSLLVNYSKDVNSIIDGIEQFLKIEIRPNIKAEMVERSKFHSKKSNEIFDEKPIENSAIPDVLNLKKLFEILQKITK